MLLHGVAAEFPYGQSPVDFGGTHVEIRADGKLCIVGTDRGRETLRLETYDDDEFLYWLFKGYVNSKVFRNYEEPYDFRRIQGAAVSEMRKISADWAERLRREQEEQQN